MPLSSSLAVAIGGTLSGALDLGTVSAPMQRNYGPGSMADGNGAGQANVIFHDQRQIAASGTDSIDLAGALLGPTNVAAVFARVKALLIAAAPLSSPVAGAPTNANDVIVGGDTNAFATWLGAATHTIRLRPGAFVALGAGALDPTGYLVTPNTGDILKIANGGAGSAVTYDVIVIGCAA